MELSVAGGGGVGVHFCSRCFLRNRMCLLCAAEDEQVDRVRKRDMSVFHCKDVTSCKVCSERIKHE